MKTMNVSADIGLTQSHMEDIRKSAGLMFIKAVKIDGYNENE